MNHKKIYIGIGIGIVLIALLVISVLIGIFSSLSILDSLRIVFGSVYVLFVPGFIITYIFFPKTRSFEEKEKDSEREKGAIDLLERIALSFALSIAIVPLAVFYLNLIGLRIILLNSFLTILGIIVISSIILYFRIKKQKKKIN
jgi:uncharacterized membrane protein